MTALAPTVVGTALKVRSASKIKDPKARGSQIGGAIGGAAASVFLAETVATAVTVAAGAAAGAAAGSVVPVVGTIIGAAVGVLVVSLAGGKITQHMGPNSVSGHTIIMTGLVKAQRWDDCDAKTLAYFDAGMGTDEEKRLFKPKKGAVLGKGKLNHSMVARFGHQGTSFPAVQCRLKSGQDIVIPGKGGAGVVGVAPNAEGTGVVIVRLSGAAAELPQAKPDGTGKFVLSPKAKVQALAHAQESDAANGVLSPDFGGPLVLGGLAAAGVLVALVVR